MTNSLVKAAHPTATRTTFVPRTAQRVARSCVWGAMTLLMVGAAGWFAVQPGPLVARVLLPLLMLGYAGWFGANLLRSALSRLVVEPGGVIVREGIRVRRCETPVRAVRAVEVPIFGELHECLFLLDARDRRIVRLTDELFAPDDYDDVVDALGLAADARLLGRWRDVRRQFRPALRWYSRHPFLAVGAFVAAHAAVAGIAIAATVSVH